MDTWTGVAGRSTMQRACRESGRPYRFSGAAHAGQTRQSGEPYISHPLAVAEILGSEDVRERQLQGFGEVAKALGLPLDRVEVRRGDREASAGGACGDGPP